MKEIRDLHNENVEHEDLIEIESAPIKEYYEFLYQETFDVNYEVDRALDSKQKLQKAIEFLIEAKERNKDVTYDEFKTIT